MVSNEQLRLQLIFAFLKVLGVDLEGIALSSNPELATPTAGASGTSSSSSLSSSFSLAPVSSNHISHKRDFLEREDLGDVFDILDSLSIELNSTSADMDVGITTNSSAVASHHSVRGININEHMDTLAISRCSPLAKYQSGLYSHVCLWLYCLVACHHRAIRSTCGPKRILLLLRIPAKSNSSGALRLCLCFL